MFFGKSKNLVGLDIGSHAIKVVELKELGKGKGYQLLNIGWYPLPSEAIVDGAILDSSIVIEGITSVFDEKKIKNNQVATGLSGHSVIIKRISLPRMSPEELAESIQWEAEQYIPFDIQDVNLAYKILDDQGGGEAENMDTLLVAVKKDKINDYTGVISQAGKIPLVVDVDSFAIQNAYEVNYALESDKVVALIDVGASVMSVNIMDGVNSLFWRDINIGGNNFTESIQRDMNLDLGSAEKLKKGEPVSGVNIDSAMPIINQVSAEISNEIAKTIDFFRATTSDKPVNKVMLSGGSCRVTGFQKQLQNKLNAEVEELNPFRNVHVDSGKFSPEFINQLSPSACVAVGLALRKLGD